MREKGLAGAYARTRFKPHPPKADAADAPDIVNRRFDGHPPRTRIIGDLACVRVGTRWCCICLPIGLCNREVVGRSAGGRKDARLVKSAFATLDFPLDEIEASHTDRGSEFDNAAIDGLPEAFGIERSPSARGCPYDNSVDESTDKIPKAGFVCREGFPTLRDLQVRLGDYVHWHNHLRLHSTLGYMGPVEFRLAGLTL